MADYWIKFYIEILDDPKMATMPDRLWRRTCELFLAAGKYGKAGLLPDTRQIAWLLRMSQDELEMDLKQIALTGIIEKVGDGWLVKKFEQRQAPVSTNDRVKAYRERQQKQQYYGNVTDLKRNVTQINRLTDNRLTEAEAEADAEYQPPHPVFNLYSREIGVISPIIADKLLDAIKEYPLEWFEPAFQESARNNARTWSYTEAILKRWKAEGFKSKYRQGGNGHKPPQTRHEKNMEVLKEFLDGNE